LPHKQQVSPVAGRRVRVGCCAGLTAGVTLAPSAAECSTSILQPAGPVAATERLVLLDALTIMLVIVVPTIIVALAFAWWFRESNRRARHLPEWAYSGQLELLVWSIPALVVFFLGGVIWLGSHSLDPARPLRAAGPQLEVQVVSLDWKWLFIYPSQGIASVNELVVPAGVPLHFTLTSASVMNAFFVPQLGSMIYVMHGMVTQLNLQADRTGEFYGESAQFSGDGFSDMHFVLRAVLRRSLAGSRRRTVVHRDSIAPRMVCSQCRVATPRLLPGGPSIRTCSKPSSRSSCRPGLGLRADVVAPRCTHKHASEPRTCSAN